MTAKLKNRSLIYETVLEYLKAEILRGNLKPGERLPTVVALAEQLDVGPASVREAYRVLETIGVLNVTQGRGTFLSEDLNPSNGLLDHMKFAEQQSISHLFETRKLLEPMVAALAAERATPAEVEAILSAAEEMEALARQEEDFIEPDVRFHELIFLASHNPVLAKIISALAPLLLDSRRLTSRIPRATEKAIHFHKLIAIAIQEGNSEAARTLMYQHVEDVERGVLLSESSE